MSVTRRAATAVLILTLVCAAGAILAGCGREKPAAQPGEPGQLYTCPMHPEVISDKPGECPKCGMDLVVKTEIPEDAAPAVGSWYCPRHPAETYPTEGRCEICGLPLALSEPSITSESPAEERSERDEMVVGNAVDADGKYLCPVMGGPIADVHATRSVEYEGKTYYFCCAGCPEQFEAEPAKFVSAIERQ